MYLQVSLLNIHAKHQVIRETGINDCRAKRLWLINTKTVMKAHDERVESDFFFNLKLNVLKDFT